MRRLILLAAICATTLAGSACFEFTSKTSPSPTTSQVLGGSWTTTQSLPGTSGSLADSCVNFTWAVTQFSGTSGSGTFTATCLGNIQVVGSASGTLTGSTVNWSATATGTVPNVPPCQIALSGTAILEANNKIRIPYSGTTCLGPVSGTEIVQR